MCFLKLQHWAPAKVVADMKQGLDQLSKGLWAPVDLHISQILCAVMTFMSGNLATHKCIL